MAYYTFYLTKVDKTMTRKIQFILDKCKHEKIETF